MSKRKRNTESSVQYYLVIDDWSWEIYKIWSIKIKKSTWDIHFFPWFQFYFSVSEWEVGELRKLDHLSFHASGEWHLIVSEWSIDHRVSKITTCILELWKEWQYENINDVSIKRTQIKNILFQEMFWIAIKDYKKLEKFKKQIDEIDQVFNIQDLESNYIQFQFTIISGKLFVKSLIPQGSDSNTSIVLQSNVCHQVERMCLWDESGNADKILEYSVKWLDSYPHSWDFTFNFYYDNPINNGTR